MNPEILKIVLLCAVLIIGVLSFVGGYFYIYMYPNRKPKLSQYKIRTDGKRFELKYRGRELDKNATGRDYKSTKDFRDASFRIELETWERKNKKWADISNEKTMKKYLKQNPEFLENL